MEIMKTSILMTVVFLGVEFETTIPTVAASLAEAESLGLSNYRVLVGAKLIEPPLRVLAHDPRLQIDGFLLICFHANSATGQIELHFSLRRGGCESR